MTPKPFNPGFRIDAIDTAVLILGAAGSAWAASVSGWLGLIIAFVVGHFFLFCNVFRLARPLELAWSAVFLTLIGSTLMNETPGWIISFSVSLIVTCVVIGLQLRKPSYHGWAWQRINPALPQWWAAQGN